MRFKQYMLNEGRSVEMYLYDALDTIKSDCSKALKQYHKNNIIYRGITDYYKGVLYIDPKSGEPRRSANTSNYYTLIMDNSKQWSKYPKRSRSIICTTDLSYANGFGFVYMVFPFDNAKIGVCSQSDLWMSFNIPEDLDMFNFLLSGIFSNELHIPLDDTNFNTLKKSFRLFDEKMKNPEIRNTIINDKRPDYFIFQYYKGDLLECIQKLFDPKRNNFKLMKIGDKLPKGREVWTDSKSIMILSIKHNVEMLNEL